MSASAPNWGAVAGGGMGAPAPASTAPPPDWGSVAGASSWANPQNAAGRLPQPQSFKAHTIQGLEQFGLGALHAIGNVGNRLIGVNDAIVNNPLLYAVANPVASVVGLQPQAAALNAASENALGVTPADRAASEQTYRDFAPSAQRDMGNIAGTIAVTMPFADGALDVVGEGANALGGAIEPYAPWAADAIRGTGNFLTGSGEAPGLLKPVVRAASKGAAGAIGGATAAEVAGKPVLPWTAGGAALGGLVGGVGGTGNAFMDALAPPLEPEHAALAQRLMDMGIPLQGSDLTPSTAARAFYSMASHVPGSGGDAAAEITRNGFYRAFAQQLGSDAPRITPSVLGDIRNEIGRGYDHWERQVSLHPTPALMSKLGDQVQSAQDALGVQRAARISALADQFKAGFNGTNGEEPMDGEFLHKFMTKGAPLSQAEKATDTALRPFASSMRSMLKGEIRSQAGPEAGRALDDLNRRYNLVQLAKPLMAKYPLGDFTPEAMRAQVLKHYPGIAYGQTGPIQDLAAGAHAFMKPPPDSGTVRRLMALRGLGTLGGAIGMGIGGYELGGGESALHGMAALPAAMIGAKAVTKLMNSKPYRNALMRNAPLRGEPSETPYDFMPE